MDEKELIEKITKEIVDKLKEQNVINSVAVPVNTEMIKNSSSVLIPSDVAKYIDHTLLKPEATASDIDTLCSEAAGNKFYSVCVNTSWVERCAKNLRGTGVKVCAVVGFPLGAMSSRAKGFETRHAIEDGASEIDMVMNVGALKSRDLNLVENDIRMVRRACGQRIILKVIIETALLTDEEIVLASEVVKKAEADFVKTSTGFSTHGATVQHIALMRRTIGPKMGVKAAGGVRTFDDAVAMINAGATRLGTSGGIKIIKGQKIESGY